MVRVRSSSREYRVGYSVCAHYPALARVAMRIFSVTEFIELVNETLQALGTYEAFAVEGEVSGYRVNQGQWVTFDLKDERSLVNVFLPIWKLRTPLEDGMRIRVAGTGRVYAKYGKFSLSAEQIELVGEGALRKALALLRHRLEQEGLFTSERKRELPRFPRRIALIASRDSAAYGDFTRIVCERWPLLDIHLYNVLVQGERAPEDIRRALAAVQASGEAYDAVVLTRGGGSFEELMAFNDEQLARDIFASRIPVLAAIGHERDVTLAEEAADVRGSTPTDAARRLVPDRRDVEYEIASRIRSMSDSLLRRLQENRTALHRILESGSHWASRYRIQVDAWASATEGGMRQLLESNRERLQHLTRLLKGLDPTAVLARGYSFVQDTRGRVISGVSRLGRGQAIFVRMKDGTAGATVNVVKKQF